MPLRKERQSRERILALGGYKSGKSTAYLSIARLAQRTGSDANFYVIESDDSTERMLETDFPELENVHSTLVVKWPQYVDALRVYMDKARPGDWIVTDLLNSAWEAVQNYFIETTYGTDPQTYFSEVAKQLKDGGSKIFNTFGGSSTDWPSINKLYKSWAQDLFYHNSAHLFCCSGEVNIDPRENMAEQHQQMFGSLGVKPAGQKETPYHVHTIIRFKQVRAGKEYRVQTLGDRGRGHFAGEVIGNAPPLDFAHQYLLLRAGWVL